MRSHPAGDFLRGVAVGVVCMGAATAAFVYVSAPMSPANVLAAIGVEEGEPVAVQNETVSEEIATSTAEIALPSVEVIELPQVDVATTTASTTEREEVLVPEEENSSGVLSSTTERSFVEIYVPTSEVPVPDIELPSTRRECFAPEWRARFERPRDCLEESGLI